MNIQLFTSEDYRENLLKQTRLGNDICYAPSYSAEETTKRSSSNFLLSPLFQKCPPRIYNLNNNGGQK